MLLKGINQAFTDSDTKLGIVTGYFSVFGNKDSDGDIIEKGAFSKTIKERGPQGKQLIKYLLDHDIKQVVAKITHLEEDGFGLKYEAKIGTHSLGKDFQAMVESGLINQHSFGYRVIKEQFDQNTKTNYLKELMMLEGSALQYLGANPNTTFIDLKSPDDVMEYMVKLEKFIRTTDATDETIIKLEEKLKSLLLILKPSEADTSEKSVAEIDYIKVINKAFENL